MNLFLIAWRPAGDLGAGEPERLLRGLTAGLPPPQPAAVTRWAAPSGRLVAACAAHDPERVGGVRYVHLEPDRLSLFAGRPIRWTSEDRADGRSPLDARFYLGPPGDWLEQLDGRWVVVRYDDLDGELELYTDALGAYPLYRGHARSTHWFSNSAELVRQAVGTREIEPVAAASMAATGWSVAAAPLWAGVSRLPRGAVLALGGRHPEREIRQLPLGRIATMPGAGFDAERTAGQLVAMVTALADWPGRPTTLQLSGGRDSRILLAAAVAGGVEVQAVTTGGPEDSDVLMAGQLCDTLGLPHVIRPRDSRDMTRARLPDTGRVLSLTSGGAISLEDATGYFTAADGAMPLWLNGQGGELARLYYGSGGHRDRDELVAKLFGHMVSGAGLLTVSGRRLLERELRAIVDAAINGGVAAADVPDAVYLDRRMFGWAAVGLGCVEYAKGDTICPLWSRHLLEAQLGLPAEQRREESFPEAVLQALYPQLGMIPHAVWSPQSPPMGSAQDRFAEVCQLARRGLEAPGCEPLWDVLDRSAVEQLLAQDATSLGEGERRQVWRLATLSLALT